MGFSGNIFAMLSSGGMSSFEFAKSFPVYTLESGPVAGIMGAIKIAELVGEKDIIAMDGGSTTTKASLVENLTPVITTEYYIGRDKFNAGYPVIVPTIDIVELGNGGTSIAWIDDGISDNPVHVKVKVRITDDEFIADFTGSSKQVQGSINSPFPATVSAVREVYMAITDPHSLPNGGFFKPVVVIAPRGTIFNPERPAPTSTYWESMSYATDLVWKALAPYIPEKLSAGHFLLILATFLGGVDDRTGEPFAIVEPQPGGWGSSYNSDGESALVASGDGETYIASAEVYEKTMPILVERCELNTEDGTGHGKYRGGFGIIKDYVVLSNEAYFTVSIGRSKYPAWGVNGGFQGTPNYCIIYKKGQNPLKVRKIAAFKLTKGDKVSLHSGGGGGWGDPKERDLRLVLEDLKND